MCNEFNPPAKATKKTKEMKEYTVTGLQEYAVNLNESGEAKFILLFVGDETNSVGICHGPLIELASELAVACHRIEGFNKMLKGALDAFKNVPYSEE